MKPIDGLINIDPNILAGNPVFTGTRVPIQALCDHIALGISIDKFLADFPSVKREQVDAVLKL